MIFGDISSFINQPSLTGIQRVVAEVFVRLVKAGELSLAILHYDQREDLFDVMTEKQIFQCLRDGDKDIAFSDCCKVGVDDFKEGDLLFDLDSVWDTVTPKRTDLYPRLKRRGVKIISYVYDITPVLAPRLTDLGVVHFFSYFIAAAVGYADVIMSETESGIAEVNELKKRLGLPVVPGYATWLGCDFTKREIGDFEPDATLAAATERRFVLMVGTLQPLKNHDVVLDAFEKSLFKKGLSLVIAGKVGWDVDRLVKRIESHPLLNKQLFLLTRLDDASINYLYKKAFCLAFSTIREGFGLPTVEALQHGTPVLESNMPVLREVGGDFCRYFDPKSPDSFIDAITPLLESETLYRALREKVAEYKPVTWDEVAEKISGILREYHPQFDKRAFREPAQTKTFTPYVLGGEIGYSQNFSGLSFDLLENLWTASREVSMPLQVSGGGDETFLELDCQTFGPCQPCTIRIGDFVIVDEAICGDARILRRIPRGAFDEEGRGVLRISLPKATSPRALKISNDRRILGLRIRSLRIVDAAEHFKCETSRTYFFGSDDGAKARSFFRYGLSHVEREFAWTDGHTAKMLVNPQTPAGADATLLFHYRAFRPRGRVVIYVNGTRLPIQRLGKCGCLKVAVPAALRGRDGLLSVKFFLPDATSPKARGISEDARELGIRLQSFSVQ